MNSPMTALGSVPKAHTQGEPEGTWNLEKLHLELKYLGRKLADAKLQREGRNRLAHRVGTRFYVNISFFKLTLIQIELWNHYYAVDRLDTTCMENP